MLLHRSRANPARGHAGLRFAACALLALVTWSSPATAPAATLTWGTSGTGGSGTWDTTLTTWYDGTTDVAWNNTTPDDAVFAGTAGTVTLGEGITAGALTFETAGYLVTADTLTLAGVTPSITMGTGVSGTIASILDGSSGLSTSGDGSLLVLTAANTYSGATTISSGTLQIGDGGVTGSINAAGGSVSSSATLAFARSDAITYSGSMTGAGNLVQLGTGTLTLTARSTLSGTLQAAAGTLQLNDGRDLSGPAVVSSGATLTIESNANGGYYQPSSLSLTTGSVNSVNTASNRYHGIYTPTITATGGASSISTPVFMNKTGTSTPQSMSISVATGASLSISGSINNHPDQINSSASVTTSGGGTLTVSGPNTFNGNMLITGGTVQNGYQAAVNSPTATGIGNMMTAGRTVTTGTGATLIFTASDAIGNYNILVSSTLVADGGTITRTGGAFNSIGNLELRNGGRLTSQNGQNATVNSFALNGNVAVTGTAASFIDTAGSSNNGIHLGTAGTTNTFNVADVTGNANADLTVSAPLINAVFGAAAGLIKTGAGTLTMSGPNSFSGNMTISAGTVVADSTVNSSSPSATSLGNMTTAGRTITTSTGATLRFDKPDAVGQFNYASPVTLIADGGTITRIASAQTFNSIGNLELRNGGRLTTTDGNAATVGSFAINGSVTVAGTSGSFIDTLSGQTTNSFVNLGTNSNNSTTFDVAATGDPTADLTVSAVLGDRVLGGAAALVKTGSGTMLMTAGNSFTGGAVLRAGTLVTRTNNGFGSGGTVTINDASTGAANTRLLIDATGGTVTMGRPITVANQGTGTTTIGAAANSGGNFATFSGAVTLNRSAILTSGSGGDRTEFTGGISGTGSVTITGPGSRVIYRSVATTYTGSTTIDVGGSLQISDGTPASASFLADTQPLVVNGVLSLAKGSNSETVGGLFGTGTVQNLVGAVTSTLIVGGGDASGTFSGLLANPSGTLAIEKTGAGTQVISGNNTYSGATTISGGQLTAGHANAFGTVGTVTIGSSGTLGIADGITFTRPLTINAGGKVRTGDNATVALPDAAALSAWESENVAGDQTYASILSGSGATVPSALTTGWTSNPNTSLYLSDILSLEGTGTGNVYVLSMTYSSIFGDMNIWYRENESSPFAPLGTIPVGEQAWNSSFATVGQYGLDTTAGTVWVVTDHNSQFVVVPEPGTLALTAVGLAGAALGLRRRRRLARS